MTGLLIQSGIGWKPDPTKEGRVISAQDGDYVAQIVQLIESRAAIDKERLVMEHVACTLAGLLRIPIADLTLIMERARAAAKQEEPFTDEVQQQRRDAMRWRALMKSARIRLWGWAGFGDAGAPADPHGYRHMGLELWTHYQDADPNEVGTVKGRTLLRDYVDAFIKGSSTMPAKSECAKAPDPV